MSNSAQMLGCASLEIARASCSKRPRGPVQHFQGDDAVEADVAGAIDLAHAAGAEGLENLVGTESASGGKRGRAGVERDAVGVQR
jgi:hypothetical protein